VPTEAPKEPGFEAVFANFSFQKTLSFFYKERTCAKKEKQKGGF